MVQNKSNFLRFISYLKPYRLRVFESGFIMFINSALNLPAPLLMMYIIDDVLVDKNKNMLTILCGVSFILICFKLMSGFMQSLILENIHQRVILDIQKNIFNHIHRLDYSCFEKFQTGYLTNRIIQDVNNTQSLFADTFLSMARNSLTLFIGITAVYIIHWKLALLSTFIFPLFILSLMFFYKKIRLLNKQVREKSAKVSSIVQESLSAYYVVKSFITEKYESRKFFRAKKLFIKQLIKTFIFGSYAGIVNGIIVASAPLILLWYGGMEIMNNNLTLGQFIAFNTFLSYLFGPARSLLSINLSIQKSLASVERIFEILDIPIKIKDSNSPLNIDIKGMIEFKNVQFSFDGKKNVLEDVNLKIKPGEMVSIIGPSGSGKTTLVNLIPRFYDPNYGSIFIDGVDIKNISLKSLRRQIGIVHQDTFLFSNSILENIKYGNRNTSFEEIKKAATIADAHRFIIELPDKYETIIGERGAKLSGGQKQRIAIARAIIKNPKILILDEAISWLDNNSIETLKESLRFLRKKCTIILITHRRAIIENFYRIVVLEKGKVFEKLDEINSLQIFESYN